MSLVFAIVRSKIIHFKPQSLGQSDLATGRPSASSTTKKPLSCRASDREQALFRGLLVFRRFGRVALCAVRVGTVEDAKAVRPQFDGELGNDMLDDLLAIWNFDDAIVLAGVELALHEIMCSFDEPFRHLRKACAEGDDVVPLCFVFPLFILALPRLLRGDAELYNGGAVRGAWFLRLCQQIR
jgi:hypothetical protein